MWDLDAFDNTCFHIEGEYYLGDKEPIYFFDDVWSERYQATTLEDLLKLQVAAEDRWDAGLDQLDF